MGRRTGIVCLLAVVLALSVVSPAQALYKSRAYYDRIAWTWKYYAPMSRTYNCLSYSLGVTDRWIWPWSGRPTPAQVHTYLEKKGYVRCAETASPRIISYGWGYNDSNHRAEISHFGKVISSANTRAKWGSLEVMTSYSWKPYYYTSYGMPITYYKRR